MQPSTILFFRVCSSQYLPWLQLFRCRAGILNGPSQNLGFAGLLLLFTQLPIKHQDCCATQTEMEFLLLHSLYVPATMCKTIPSNSPTKLDAPLIPFQQLLKWRDYRQQTTNLGQKTVAWGSDPAHGICLQKQKFDCNTVLIYIPCVAICSCKRQAKPKIFTIWHFPESFVKPWSILPW